MEDNAFEKLKSMVDNGNIPEEFKNIISNINSSNSSNSSPSKNSSISPEAISNLMSLLNSKSNEKNRETYGGSKSKCKL